MKITLIVLAIVVLVGGYIFFSPKNNQNEDLNTLLSWSGVTKIPDWAQNQHIETKGNAATREFVMSFEGTKEQISEWVKTEPALKNATKDLETKYILVPQNGAQYAEVIIENENKVILRTYWS